MPLQTQFPATFLTQSSSQELFLSVTTTSSPQTVTFTRVMSYQPFRISWGDGTESEIAANRNSTITHPYAVVGTYAVSIEKAEQVYRLELIASSCASCETGEIGKLVNAQTLFLQNIAEMKIAAGELGRLQSLKVLYIHGVAEGNVYADPGELASLSNLESISFFKMQNIPLAAGEIRNFPNLRVLSFSSDTVKTKFIGEGDLSSLPNLETLALNSVNVSAGYGEIGSLVNLTSLNLLTHPNIFIAPGELGGLTRLTSLYVNNVPNLETGVGEIGNLVNLTSFTSYYCANMNPNAGLDKLIRLNTFIWGGGAVSPVLTQATCDLILKQLYEMGANRIATGGTITISGGQSISLPDGPACPPTSGGMYRYELRNNSCGNYPKTWNTVTTPALADPVLPDELADLGVLIETSRLRTPIGFNDVV